MGVQYRLDIMNRAGLKVAEIGGTGKASFLELGCDKGVNAVGQMMFTLNYEHAAVPLIADMYLVHLYRRWPEKGIPWYLFFPGIFRDPRFRDADGRSPRATYVCLEQKHILSWAINAYAAGATDKSKFTARPAETILKRLVTNNLTATGTTGFGRDVNATSGGGSQWVYRDSRG